ncbi:unnamed protein product [Arabis nemorensis]|uniref:F-box associated beta-propeller type 3 domain-containing protein n=1 Tax=Arabis nemorensis TaxID=586526 RepID=A0A565AV12_9BRAS|nr:unnamed protein product [Arabis nemorensis]
MPMDFLQFTSEKGIVCIKDQYHNVRIINPASGQLKKLPRLEIKIINPDFDRFLMRTMTRSCFFGFLDGTYKVLQVSKTTNGISGHIFTLGDMFSTSGDSTWRRINYQLDNEVALERDEKSICIDGVIFYLAKREVAQNENTRLVVRFELLTEKFTLIEVLVEMMSAWSSSVLANVHGRLAIGQSKAFKLGITTLWTFNHDSSSWSSDIIKTMPLCEGFGDYKASVNFKGATPHGDLLFSVNVWGLFEGKQYNSCNDCEPNFVIFGRASIDVRCVRRST